MILILFTPFFSLFLIFYFFPFHLLFYLFFSYRILPSHFPLPFCPLSLFNLQFSFSLSLFIYFFIFILLFTIFLFLQPILLSLSLHFLTTPSPFNLYRTLFFYYSLSFLALLSRSPFPISFSPLNCRIIASSQL